MDKLYLCAQTFNNLLKTTKYELHIGSKQKLKVIYLDFRKSDFYHLAGLQYLQDDIYVLKGNKERIFKEILSKEITYNDICKSNNLSYFIERENLIINLESFIDNFRLPLYKKVTNIVGSNIQADFIFFKDNRYYFTIERNPYGNHEIYAFNSLFENTSNKYIAKQQKFSILKLCKYNKIENTMSLLYQSPSYQ